MAEKSMAGDALTRCLKRNERIDDFIRSPEKNKRTCNGGGGESTELLVPGDLHWDSNQDVLSELSEAVALKLSKSAVSITLSNGHMVLFACSGIPVKRKGLVTRFLTSASLVRVFNDSKKHHDNLKVEVCHEDNVVIGFLGEYHLGCGIASVHVMALPDVDILFLRNVQCLPHRKVVSAGRDISGKLMTTSGILTGDSNGSAYPNEKLMSSTCKIPEASEGGPLFDFDGNFLGINLLLATEGTFFLPAHRVLDRLVGLTPLDVFVRFPAVLKRSKPIRIGVRRADVLHKDQHGDLDSMGYPKPPVSMSDGNMVLVNTFEEIFGDTCGEGVWSELSETVSSNIQDNVVALASFSGETRFFACTGFFVDWNGCATILTSASLVRQPGSIDRINENLRIEVLLPNKQRRVGTLQHYNLYYNIALVNVKDFHAPHPANVQHRQHNYSCVLVAVGLCFKDNRLMATKGKLGITPPRLDHRFLECSTCKITKVGIGGPLVQFDGNFIGMNFYDKKFGTPYVPDTVICKVLEQFNTEGSIAQSGHAGNHGKLVDTKIIGEDYDLPCSWYVPKPYWCDPDVVDKSEAGTGYVSRFMLA